MDNYLLKTRQQAQKGVTFTKPYIYHQTKTELTLSALLQMES